MGHCHDPSSRLLPSPPPQTQPLVWGREAKYCTPIILAAPFTNFRQQRSAKKQPGTYSLLYQETTASVWGLLVFQ